MVGLKQSYSDVLLMPTIERRFYLQTLREANQKHNDEVEEGRESTTSTGNGSRTRKISGPGLNN